MTERAYLLPENPDPDDLRCFKVYLPNDPGFDRAFWGSMEFLASWKAWERDVGKNGAVAANAMKAANEKTLSELAIGGCNPIIQPPYTEVLPDGRTPEEATIDDYIHFVFVFITIINDRIDSVVSIPDIVDELAPVWTAQTGSPGVGVITELAEGLYAQTALERAEAEDLDFWKEVRNDVLCELDETCPNLIQFGQYESYYQYLNCAAERIYTSLNVASQWLFDTLNAASAFLSGNNAAQAVYADAGGGGGFGFGEVDCGWIETFDFQTGGTQGWELTTIEHGPWTDLPQGGSPGPNGWGAAQKTIQGHDGQLLWQLAIRYDITTPTTNIRKITVRYFVNNPATDPIHLGYRMRAYDGAGFEQGNNPIFPVSGEFDLPYAFTGETVDQIWAGISSCNNHVGKSYIRKIIVEGVNENPFS